MAHQQSNNPLADLIFNADDLPDDPVDGKSEFWNMAHSHEFKSICLISLLHSIPDSIPTRISDEECRAILSSICAVKMMLRKPELLKQYQEQKKANKEESEQEEDPLKKDLPTPGSNFKED